MSGLLQVRGNGHGTGDNIEKDVPLSAEKHECHGGDLHAAVQANQKKKDHGKQSGGWNRGSELHERLRDTRETRVEADGDAGGDGPERANEQGKIDAEKSEAGTAEEEEIVTAVKLSEFAKSAIDAVDDNDDSNGREKQGKPTAGALRARGGERLQRPVSHHGQKSR